MRSLMFVIAFLWAAAARASPASDLDTILADHWRWWLVENPVEASALGEHAGDGKLRDLSLAAEDRRAADASKLLARLASIRDPGLDDAGRTNKAILANTG